MSKNRFFGQAGTTSFTSKYSTTVSDAQIASAVEDYLEENPVEGNFLTASDLADYATNDDVSEAITAATGSLVSLSTLDDYVSEDALTTALNSYATITSVNNALSAYSTTTAMNTAIDNKIAAVTEATEG